MKLLLTSSGIDNKSVAKVLQELVGKAAGETKIGFVPTAANAQNGNKDWFINQFLKFWRYGYNWVDVVDPSAAGIKWQERLAECDAIFIGGGNIFHLLDQTRKTGFDKWINKHKEKVFVGASAGAVIFTPSISIASNYGDDNYMDLKDLTGLNWVDFEVAPHYEQSLNDMMKKHASKIDSELYAIDDQTAIKVESDKVKVITEGFWELFNR